MNYSGEHPGSRNYYSGYRGSYRGKSYRGGRGGYKGNSSRFNQSYPDPASNVTGYRDNYRDNYREGYYQRSAYYQRQNRQPYNEPPSRQRKSSGASQGTEAMPESRHKSAGDEPESTSSSIEPPVVVATSTHKPLRFSEWPFVYLTGLDQTMIGNEPETSKVRDIFRQNDSIDAKLEEQKLQLWKSELELGLLSTQCEKDILNVRLTQENLDALLLM
ncbi:LAMI_0H07272g1_1 [Lachancea mirantina]|uniref:LAMI_0H07272g1_1 n=1 Tax=Lachancea mirantina TaxID=1230905 RepID=A0A1G4KFH7_9SACH|nr:LAMI_0H07272g1_1 [Lachancea mirantina]